MWVLIVLSILLMNGEETLASDPDPMHDYCIPVKDANNAIVPGQCKKPSEVCDDDFIFKGFKFPGNMTDLGFSVVLTNPDKFPGTNTMGLSFLRIDLKPNGVNPPHIHPRASEAFFVVHGKIYAGFVDTTHKIYSKVLDTGDMMIFPRGMIHFQMNVGTKDALIFAVLNSGNPGNAKIANAVFGSGIKEELLEKAFTLNRQQLAILKQKFETKPPQPPPQQPPQQPQQPPQQPK